MEQHHAQTLCAPNGAERVDKRFLLWCHPCVSSCSSCMLHCPGAALSAGVDPSFALLRGRFTTPRQPRPQRFPFLRTKGDVSPRATTLEKKQTHHPQKSNAGTFTFLVPFAKFQVGFGKLLQVWQLSTSCFHFLKSAAVTEICLPLPHYLCLEIPTGAWKKIKTEPLQRSLWFL